ncbi:MAG: hypothetical protein GY750_15115 [Lentisphaerae bacterium]|nr:hypothetical protein [Lentisphaerota bacterium]MCP4102728.1 hypothetical protein [Lentisphaerota bacterium]
MNINKAIMIVPFALALVISSGCNAIRHKSFRVVTSGTGGKMTTTDSTGSGTTPTPSVIIRSYYSSITTIPPGTKAKYKAKSYELFSGNPLFEEVMEIDTTNGKVEITEKKVEYNRD